MNNIIVRVALFTILGLISVIGIAASGSLAVRASSLTAAGTGAYAAVPGGSLQEMSALNVNLPQLTSTPTSTPTPGCCIFTANIQASCSYDPGSQTYTFNISADVLNSCGQTVSTSYNFYLEGSTDGVNFYFIARTSIENHDFTPGHNFLMDQLANVSVPSEYVYYRIRMQVYNCGIYELYSQPATLCGPVSTGTPTITPVPSSSTATATSTRTATLAGTATPTHTSVATSTATPTRATPTRIPTSTSTPTATVTPITPTASITPISTTTPTDTPAPSPANTDTATPVLATPTSCAIEFNDVPQGSTFYQYIHCLACLGIVNGYPDGTFKPNNNVTRGQLSKIVSNSAGFSDNQTVQMFQDVPAGSTFFQYIGRLASRGYISGYPCGGVEEPCVPPDNLPYFRPNANATRGQISKIDANAAGFNDAPSGQQFQDVPVGSTYYTYTYRLVSRSIMSGYPCGGVGEPCVPPANLPYFRPNANATRGQTSKIDANTFFPDCQTP